MNNKSNAEPISQYAQCVIHLLYSLIGMGSLDFGQLNLNN